MTITETYFHCTLQGAQFDPIPFLNHSDLVITDYHQRGDIATKGRFKGQPLETGHVRMEAKTGNFDQFVETLCTLKPLLLNSQAETKELHLFLGYTSQCNWEFTPDSLAKTAEMGLTLTMSCDRVEEES
ncbi:hypothetical protein QUF64_05175 [Anaerolineales bacterium HSG6]|nr:hypothetical protein [Anaerolineales bacterium HSG6]